MGNLSEKKSSVLHLNSAEGGEASSDIKMIICQDKDNKSYSFRKQKEIQLVPHIVKKNYLCHYVQKGVTPATLF